MHNIHNIQERKREKQICHKILKPLKLRKYFFLYKEDRFDFNSTFMCPGFV